MPVFHAPLVFPADRAPIRNGYLSVDDEGKVLSVGDTDPECRDVTHVEGAILPGFVNAHCHLELSHLRGRVDTGTGLLPFLKAVVTLRDVDPAEIQSAIRDNDAHMWAHGIQACGDISNTADTAAVKHASPIRYYTFVEAFDFLQGGKMAEGVLAKALQTYEQQPEPKRLVPHAPYTVSPKLYKGIFDNNPTGGTISIHNQEVAAEDELFTTKTGGFIDFYRDFGFSLDAFTPFGRTSLAATLPYLDPGRRNLFVHNTQTTTDDIERAEDWSDKVYWATCPNANLYIENQLPRYDRFEEAGVRVCIGTDSLSSNWQLCVLEEMKTIQRYQSAVDTRTLVQWATLNGAEALGFDAEMGSLTPGKVPGVICVSGVGEDGKLTRDARVRRLL